MPKPLDLASLADLKAWLGIANTNSDASLAGLITAVSQTFIGSILNRGILPQTVSETRDGTGTRRMLLREWPVLSISSLLINGSAVLAQTSAPFGPGYVLPAADPYPPGAMTALTLPIAYFDRGYSNVAVTYRAGYQVSAEAATIPASPYAVTVAQPYGNWASDGGVTFANGTPLIPVPSAPAAGQYAVAAATGIYTFAAADTGKAVLISYGYVPAQLRQACIEAAGERFRYKDRIGITSQSLAGKETITYTLADVSKPVAAMLAAFERVLTP